MNSTKYINKRNLVRLRYRTMVNALIQLSKESNRVINVVKAKYDFKDKSEAVEFIVNKFVESEEPELHPEFVKEVLKASKEKSIPVKSLSSRYLKNVRH